MIGHKKRLLRARVRKCVDSKNTIEDVKNILLEDGEIIWSTTDESYIEYKYMKYCLLNIKAFTQKQLAFESLTSIRRFLKVFVNLENISDLAQLGFASCPHFELLHQTFASNESTYRTDVLRKLQQLLIPDILIFGEGNDLCDDNSISSKFTQLLLKYLTDFKTQFLESFQPTDLFYDTFQEHFDPDWLEYTRPHRNFEREVSRQHASIYSDLCKEKKKLTDTERKMIPIWCQLIEDTLTVSELRVEKRDERKILTVNRPIIVLSKCLPKIQKYFATDPKISEVHFIAKHIMYINASLHEKYWHGKNILVLARKINCLTEGLQWDVSGSKGKDFGETKPVIPIPKGIPGINGENGGPGESGGNVTFIVKEYINANNFTICTNGGHGGNGQVGGDGQVGTMGIDGNWIRYEDLEKNFETPITLFGNKTAVILQNVKKLRDMSSIIVDENFVGFNEMGEKTGDRLVFPERSIFMKGDLKNGGQFEYCFSQWSLGRGVYLLFNGAKGTLGGSGGDGGLGGYGGEGGFPGNVVCLNFIGESMHNIFKIYGSRGLLGNDGENGKDGKNGKDGENGLDVGYVDIYNKTIKYYLPGNYKVVSCSATDNSIYCKYLETYRAIQSHIPEKLPRETSQKVRRERSNRAIAQKQAPIDLENAFRQLSSLTLTAINSESCGETTRSEWNEIRETAEQTMRQNEQNHATSEAIRVTYTIPDGQTTNISTSPPDTRSETKLNTFLGNIKIHPSFCRLQNSFIYHEQYIIQQAHGTEHNTLSRSLDISDISKWKYTTGNDTAIRNLLQKCLTTRIRNYENCPLEEQDFLILNKFTNNMETEIFSNEDKWPELLTDYINLLWRNIFRLTKCVIQLVAELYQKNIKFYTRESTTSSQTCTENSPKSKLDFYHFLELDKTRFRRILLNRDWTEEGTCISSLLETYKEPQLFNSVQYNCAKQHFIDQLANNTKVTPACASVLMDSWPKEVFMMFWDLNLTDLKETNWLALYNISTEIADSCWNHTSIFPPITIMSMLQQSSWSRELCYFLLIKAKPKHLPVSLIANLRYILDQIPNEILDRLYSVCLAGLRSDREDIFSEHYTLFESISELSTPNHLEFLDFFDNISSTTEISHQLDEITIRLSLKKLDKKISWIDSETRFSESLYNLQGILEKYGKIKTNMLLSILLEMPSENFDTNVSDLLQNINSGRCKINDSNLELLRNSVGISVFMTQTENQKEDANERDLEALVALVLLDTGTDCQIKDEIKKWWDLNKSTQHYSQKSIKLDKIDEANQTTVTKNQENWCLEFQSKVTQGLQPELVAEVLHRIDLVINKHFGHTLRCTQHLAIVIAILSDKKLLAEISTGEGKSYIVLALAIIKGLCGIQTDIITSSKVLAQRDANEFRKIYQEFGLSAGHITMENSMERTTNYNKTVVYGEVSQFQRDFLQDRFYTHNVRGSRPYESIIIDEVDSMFLDKGNNVLYMSHSPSNLDEVESILVYIWVQTLEMLNSDEYEPLQLHQNILSSFFPPSTGDMIQERIEELEIKDITVRSIWEILILNKVINKYGKIELTRLTKLATDNVKLSSNKILDLNIKYILLEQAQRKMDTKRCPEHLKEFVKLHLFTWIKNAYKATELEEGAEYVLSTDYLSPTKDKSPSILLLDLDTGTDLKNSQWGDGLHQFLQLKHGCKLTTLSLKSVFISNISYFKKYTRIFGLSGTLGTVQDRYFLKNTYEVNFLTVPTFLPKTFIEEPAIVSTEMEVWKEKLLLDASEKLETRSVLILCETIQMAEEIAKFLSRKIVRRAGIHLYRRDFEPFTVALNKSGLNPGELIIATNLAGRGTDIKLSETLKKCGGLHVIFSYLPNNNRVKLQGFGRASRCGDPGSGRLIFLSDFMENEGNTISAVEHMNQQNKMEMHRVDQIISHYENVVCMEEKTFENFELMYQKVCQCLSHASSTFTDYFKKSNDESQNDSSNQRHVDLKEINDIIRQNMMDDWVFWMDKYSKRLQEMNQQNFSKDLISRDMRLQIITADYKKFTKKYNDVVKEYDSESIIARIKTFVGLDYPFLERKSLTLIHTPALLVKLAKYYIKIRQWKEAVKQLKKVIDRRDNYTVSTIAAKYYKLFCYFHNNDISNSELAEESNDILLSIKDQICFQNYLVRCILRCPQIPQRTSSILHSTGGFQKQKEATIELLLSYQKSIEKLFGAQNIDPNVFLDILHGDPLSSTLFFQELISGNILSKTDPKHSLDEEDLFSKLKTNKDVDFWQTISSSSHTHQMFALIENSGYEESFYKDFRINVENDLETWINDNLKSKSDCVVTTAGETFFHFDGSILIGDEDDFESHPEFLYFRRLGKARLETFFIVNTVKFKTLISHDQLQKENFFKLPFFTTKLTEKFFLECEEIQVIDSKGHLLNQEFHSVIQEKLLFAPNHLKLKVCELFEHVFANQLEQHRIIKYLQQPNPPKTGHYLDKIVYSKILHNRNGLHFKGDAGNDNVNQKYALNTEQFKKILSSSDCLSSLLPNMVLHQSSDLKILYPKSSDNFIDKVYQFARYFQWVDKEGNITSDEHLLENVPLTDPNYLLALHEIKTYFKLRRQYRSEDFRKQMTERLIDLGPNLTCDNNLTTYLAYLTPEVMPSLDTSMFLQREYQRLVSYGLQEIVSLKERPSEILFACAFGIGLLKVVVSLSLILNSAGSNAPISFFLAREGIYEMFSSFKKYEDGTLKWKDLIKEQGSQIVSLATGAFPRSLAMILVESSQIVLLELFKLGWFQKVLKFIENYTSSLITSLSNAIMKNIETKLTDNIQYTNVLRELARNFDDQESKSIFHDASETAASNAFCLKQIQERFNFIKSGANIGLNTLMDHIPKVKNATIATISLTTIIQELTHGILHTAETTIFVRYIQSRVHAFLEETERIILQKLKVERTYKATPEETSERLNDFLNETKQIITDRLDAVLKTQIQQPILEKGVEKLIMQASGHILKSSFDKANFGNKYDKKSRFRQSKYSNKLQKAEADIEKNMTRLLNS